jgi:hypothetical protein
MNNAEMKDYLTYTTNLLGTHMVLVFGGILLFTISSFICIRSYARLRHIPGPFVAAWTNLVRRGWVQTGNLHLIHTEMHQKYGKVFRYGPNHVLIMDPNAIPIIFGHNAKFAKVSISPTMSQTQGTGKSFTSVSLLSSKNRVNQSF